MRLKFVAAALAAITVSSMPMPVSAQQQQQQQTRNWLPAATVATPFAIGAAMGGSATSFAWTTVATKTWTFPWAHGRFPIFTSNYVPQGIHATGQYVHNVINPTYFNETLHISNIHQPSGTHSTSAQYNQRHQQGGTSNKTIGKVMVGCIFGSALGAITSSMRKATAMGNPPRWRSQAEHERILASGYEKQFELTSNEANTALALCGLGSFALHWPQRP